MSEMVERSARAMVVRTAELTGGDPATAWDTVGPLTQGFMYQMARAVLETIREPTEQMILAAMMTSYPTVEQAGGLIQQARAAARLGVASDG